MLVGEDDDPMLVSTTKQKHKPPFSRVSLYSNLLISLIFYIYIAEDDIIQPLMNIHNEEEDIFLPSQKRRLLIKRRSVYDVYCKLSKPM